MQMASLTPNMYDNFNAIVSKYPGLSKDLAMAMVAQGITPDMPGIGKVVSMDGIAQLKNDALNVDKIKATVDKDRGFLGAIEDTLKNVVYDPLKGATRLGFAALRYPYDAITAATRDISVGKMPKPVYGSETQLGALVADVLGGKPGVQTGSGFFLDPKSRVGKAQAKAMGAYGRVYGQSFTIGRWSAKSIGASPDSTAYKVMSGFIDATLNIAADPTTWLGVSAILKGAKARKKLTEAIEQVNEAKGSNKLAKLDAEIKDLARTRWGLIKDNTTRIESRIASKERNLMELEQKKSEALSGTLETLLNGFTLSSKALEKSEIGKQTLSIDNIVRFMSTHPKVQSGELLQAVDKLGAEVKNTRGFAGGNVITDELPEQGMLSIGAHGLDEFFVTNVSKEPVKVLDLSSELGKLTGRELEAEQFRRAEFLDLLKAYSTDAEIPTVSRNAFAQISRLSKEDLMQLRGYAWALPGMEGTSNFTTLGGILAKLGEIGDVRTMELAYEAMAKIWDFDVIANVRNVYGETGGFLLANSGKFGLVEAQISNTLAEIADPSNLGPNLLGLMDSIGGIDKTIVKTRSQLDKARLEATTFEQRVKELDAFRLAANQDLETRKLILNDPNYQKLKGIVDIDATLSEKKLAREWLNEQVGLTDYLGGNLANDFSKPLKWMLGKNFQNIAAIVAKETDALAIQRLFGNKLEFETNKALAKATTPDEVYSIFLNLLNPTMGDPQVFRSLALRSKASLVANPVARLVEPVSLKSLKVAEALDKAYGRLYVRSTIINLGDGSQTVYGYENWFSSARFKTVMGGKAAQERFIDDVIRKLYAAESAVERGAILEKANVDLHKIIVDRIGLDKDSADELFNYLKFGSKEKKLMEEYSVIKRATGTDPTFTFAGEEPIVLGKAVSLDQMLSGQAFLPDSQAITKALIRYQKNKLVHGVKAGRVLAEELGDMWRTAQLVFRISYMLRNIGEMQMRQMFSGHASIFSHPIQFIAFVMAASGKNGPLNKAAGKIAKWQYDALGNKITSVIDENDMSVFQKEYMLMNNRATSTSNYQQSSKAEVWKYYSQADTSSPDYFKGLSHTLNRFAVDEVSSSVAKLMTVGDEDAKWQYVDRLISEFDKPGNPIREMSLGAFERNQGIKSIFFRNAELPLTKENLHRERIFAYLFDETPGNQTYANSIRAVAGNGPASSQIMDIIAGGAKIATPDGNFITISSPWTVGNVTTDQRALVEAKFAERLERIFKREDLANSTVLVAKQEFSAQRAGKAWTNITEGFFTWVAGKESKYNFGPEFTMSYWDYVVKYAPLLGLDDLKRLETNAVKAFAPINKVVGDKRLIVGSRISRQPLKILRKEISKKEAAGIAKTDYSLETISNIAARDAAKRVSQLFYDAAKQKQWAQALRLVFPFAQAHTNTLSQWGKLTATNPVPIYRFGKAYDALTKQGSNVIYDISGVTYDDDQGFFYKDPNSEDLKFKMPLVGSFLGALAGKNISAKDAMQITAPVQSMNLAFGQASPLAPGFGPAAQILFVSSGKAGEFGAAYDILRDIVTPFGQIQGPADIVFPSWLKKTFMYFLGDNTLVNRGMKDWASYLASTGNYGDNPLADDATRDRLFNDAQSMSKIMGILTGLFQSISPATPQTEVLLKIKNPENKMKFMTSTILYQYWDEIINRNPGDYGAAVREFGETFGVNNLMIALGGTTSAVRGTEDAWSFMNNNPDAVAKYGKGKSDVLPYFFPGGANFAMKYYNWQSKTGVRRPLNRTEIEQEAEGMIYAMRKDQIVDEQIANGYTQFWYVDQIAKLDKEFGGRPSETVTTNTIYERLDRIGKALADPAFRQSPIYAQVAEFYPQFNEYQTELNRLKVSNYSQLKSKGGYATILRDNLVGLAERLMLENPSFSRMYYGVFAGQLEG